MTLSRKPDDGKLDKSGAEKGRRADRDERIAAYVEGEMSPGEAAQFEEMLDSDATLRSEVEEWRNALRAAREWLEGDAPGAERVAALEIPSLAGGQSVSRSTSAQPSRKPATTVIPIWSRRAAAVAAVFAAGFFIGHWTKSPVGLHDSTSGPSNGNITDNQGPGPETPSPIPPKPTDEVRPSAEMQTAGLPPMRYSTDPHGRPMIQTSLIQTGASISWVVDPGFQLASSQSN